jgi:hypothetical protein
METSWINVKRSDGEGVGNKVYVNGNYADTAGFVGTPFEVETGDDIFETLDSNKKVDWRKRQTIEQPPPGDSEDHAVPVILKKVTRSAA